MKTYIVMLYIKLYIGTAGVTHYSTKIVQTQNLDKNVLTIQICLEIIQILQLKTTCT